MKKILILLSAILCFASCEKEQSMTQINVELLRVAFFPPSQVVLNGRIETTGYIPGSTDIRYGVALGNSSQPTIQDRYWYFKGEVVPDENKWPHNDNYTMVFEDNFILGNTYYIRAMAVTESETSVVYGNEYSFSVPRSFPVIDTALYVNNVTSHSADVYFTINGDGGSCITDCGIRLSFTPDMADSFRQNYTIDPSQQSQIIGKQSKITLTGLQSNTRYQIRAYATNASGGTAYTYGYYFDTK